jgi:Ribonucleases G and E
LVSIDVNSGRSTREHHIEDTALKTNLEAPRKSPASCACAIWRA